MPGEKELHDAILELRVCAITDFSLWTIGLQKKIASMLASPQPTSCNKPPIAICARMVCEANQEASVKIRRGPYFARRPRLLLLDGFVFGVAERFEIASD